MERFVIELYENQSQEFRAAYTDLTSKISVNQWLKDNRAEIQQQARTILTAEQIRQLTLLKAPHFRGVLYLKNIPQPDILPPTPHSGSRDDESDYLPEYVVAAIATAADMEIKDQKAFDITPNDRFGRNNDPNRPIPPNDFHFDAQNAPLVFLSCKRGNVNASTDFIDVKELLKVFLREEIDILKSKIYHEEDESREFSILTDRKGILTLRDYINLKKVQGKTEESRSVLEKLKEIIPEHTLSVTLRAGEAVAFNNDYVNQIMHGQTNPYFRNKDAVKARWITRQYAYPEISESQQHAYPEISELQQHTTNSAMQVSSSIIAKIASTFRKNFFER
jgi:hypothetical protein